MHLDRKRVQKCIDNGHWSETCGCYCPMVIAGGLSSGWGAKTHDEKLVCTLVDRRLHEESFAKYLKWLEQDIVTWPDGTIRVVLNEVPSPADFGPDKRKRLADVLNRHASKRTLLRSPASYSTTST